MTDAGITRSFVGSGSKAGQVRLALLLGIALPVLSGCQTRESTDIPPTLPKSPPPARLEFTRLIAHWAGYADPGYLPFVDEVKPEIAQVGFYGAHFWSLADTAFGRGYPANLPVRGHRACGEWFANLNTELHRRGVKVVGHLNVKFLVGDPDSPEGPRGFFRFYRDQWDESLLGRKPVADPMEFLEKDKSGQPISEKGYGIGGMREYWACLNNPHWRQVLKAWVRCGIGRGVDGFIANYFYRHDCHCSHCVAAFRRYLRQRFTAAELKAQFGITNLATHEFDEIVGWHSPAQSTPLRREMLRFSQIANKEAFDEVFVQYGRSVKPGLIVAQWNHLGDFAQISGDERCLLPGALWGRDEDYLWYSTGGPNTTDIAAGILGEATLQARYIRGAFDDKPFTLGKYENIRIRAAIAELAANGGAPMGFYTAFEDPEARRELVRYYGFLRRYESLYRANQPHAEVLLLFPRARIHAGDLTALARFKKMGKLLLDAHVLFDVLPKDEGVPARSLKGRMARYLTVIDPSDAAALTTNLLEQLPAGISHFEAPVAVRVSASRPATHETELTLHFVNYNRQEPSDQRNAGKGVQDEKPIPAPSFESEIRLDTGAKVQRVEFLAPEQEQGHDLAYEQLGSRLRVRVPEFLVYGVMRIECASGKGNPLPLQDRLVR